MEVREVERSRRETVTALLARANLHRLRNEWEAAEELCLQALRIDPEDPEPHRILGDLYLSQNKLESAQRWFELALELQPESVVDQEKLVIVRQRLLVDAENHAAERVRGHQRDSSGAWVSAIGITLLLAFVGLVTFSLTQPKSNGRGTLTIPITAPPVTKSPVVVAPPKTEPQLPLFDRTLRTRVAEMSQLGDQVLGTVLDPRTNTLMVSVLVPKIEEGKNFAAILGRAALMADPEVMSVVTRCVLDDRVVYVGELPRERYDGAMRGRTEISAAALRELVTNEWTPTRTPAKVQTRAETGGNSSGLLQ